MIDHSKHSTGKSELNQDWIGLIEFSCAVLVSRWDFHFWLQFIAIDRGCMMGMTSIICMQRLSVIWLDKSSSSKIIWKPCCNHFAKNHTTFGWGNGAWVKPGPLATASDPKRSPSPNEPFPRQLSSISKQRCEKQNEEYGNDKSMHWLRKNLYLDNGGHNDARSH